MSKNAPVKGQNARPFVLEIFYKKSQASAFAKSDASEPPKNSSRGHTLSDHIVAFQQSDGEEITYIVRTRNDGVYVPVDENTLTEIFKKQGYDVVSAADQKATAANSKAPAP